MIADGSLLPSSLRGALYSMESERISELEQAVLGYLSTNIEPGSDVLDIGCGVKAMFYSTAFIAKAKSVDWNDINSDAIDYLNNAVGAVTPEYLAAQYRSLFAYLAQIGVQISPEEFLANLHDKLGKIECKSFFEAADNARYDEIIAIESVEVLNTIDEYRTVLQNCFDLLRPGGRLHAFVLNFDVRNEGVEAQIADRIEGELNPDAALTTEILQSIGFDISHCISERFSDMANYSSGYFIKAVKP